MRQQPRRTTPRRRLLLLLAAALLAAAPAAGIDGVWIDVYDGPDHLWDGGQAIAPGPDGSVYVSGYSYQWEIPDELAIAAWVLARIGPDGTRLWERRDVTGGSGGGPDELVVDGAGNLLVLGTVQPFSGIEVQKFSPAGELLWARGFVPPEGQFCTGAALAVGPGDTVHAAWFEYNLADVAAVAKLSPAGEVDWVRRWEGPASTGAAAAGPMAVAVDAAGASFVAGWVDLDSALEMALWKYSESGDFEWYRTAGSAGSLVDDWATDLVVDGDSLVVAGTFGGNSGLGTDLALARYDLAGERAWLTTFRSAGSASDQAHDLEVAATGQLYLAGSSWLGASGTGALVAAFDAAGTHLWAQRFDGEGEGYGTFLRVRSDASGRAFAAGWDSDGLGVETYLVAGLETSGAVAWLHRFSPVAGQPSGASDLCVSGDDAVVVTGETWLEDPEGGFDQDLVTVRFHAQALFVSDFEIGDPGAWTP